MRELICFILAFLSSDNRAPARTKDLYVTSKEFFVLTRQRGILIVVYSLDTVEKSLVE